MELALLIDDYSDYKGRNVGNYDLRWGSPNNGLNNMMRFYSKYENHFFETLYYGNEFCEYRLPSINQISSVIELCKKDGLKLAIVTPVVTDYGIHRIEQILNYLEDNKIDHEIVVNDIGVLELIRERNMTCKVVLGRVFDKLSHDSRASIDDLYLYYGNKGLEFAKTPGVVSNSSRELFEKYGISRYEFDSPKVGLKIPSGINSSLYWPYNYLTTGRVCLLKSLTLSDNKKFLVGDSKCECLCKTYRIEKRKPVNGYAIENGERITDVYLFQKGNTVFYLNDNRITDQCIDQFNRLVIQV